MTFNPCENSVQYDLLTADERDELMREGPLLVWVPELNGEWRPVDRSRNFRGDAVYRRAPKPAAIMPTVDWSCFGPAIKAVAFDEDGYWKASDQALEAYETVWTLGRNTSVATIIGQEYYPAHAVTRGTCDWKDSLVIRPEGV